MEEQESPAAKAQDSPRAPMRPRRIGLVVLVSVVGFLAGITGGLVSMSILVRLTGPLFGGSTPAWMVMRAPAATLPSLASIVASTVDVFATDAAEEPPTLLPLDRRTGRGVALTTDGWIVTTRAAVPLDRRIRPVIVTSDRRMIVADRIATDPSSDLVFLHVAGARMAVLPLRDRDDLDAGDPLVIPTADGGMVPVTVRTRVAHVAPGSLHMSDRFATLLSVHGAGAEVSVGAPVVDRAGALVGVLADATHAIPVAAIASALPTLFRDGVVARNALGIRYRDAAEFGYLPMSGREEGITLAADRALPAVDPRGPSRGILMAGDTILAVEDDPLTGRRPLPELLQEYPLGSRITLRVLRDSQSLTIPMTLAVHQGSVLVVARAAPPPSPPPAR
ncbi:serine protease [Candidatus Uhrbacteria bacterium]|nr:serine protease [Candidatus Uhrbacteria bacterium]